MKHEIVEKNVGLLAILILVVISFGGLAQIVPLFFQKKITEPVDGLEPLSALELEGRGIYRREGCVGCHSQMVRPFRAETERYGHYNVAGELVYEHNFLWGSKRTGPDLARVGGRYSDDWASCSPLQHPRCRARANYSWLTPGCLKTPSMVTPRLTRCARCVN